MADGALARDPDMCGICGQYHFGAPRPVEAATVKAMARSIARIADRTTKATTLTDRSASASVGRRS
jgi:hypothetical protein